MIPQSSLVWLVLPCIHSVLSDLPCPRLSLVLMHLCCYGYCRRAINAVVVVNEA